MEFLNKKLALDREKFEQEKKENEVHLELKKKEREARLEHDRTMLMLMRDIMQRKWAYCVEPYIPHVPSLVSDEGPKFFGVLNLCNNPAYS